MIRALLALSFLASTAALADDVTTADIARLLVNNPIAQLEGFPKCNDRLASAVATPVSDGVVSYELVFLPGNFCAPVQATVTIVEDLTATRHDGPKSYQVSLSTSDIGASRKAAPRCVYVGTRSEGWVFDGKFLRYDNCANKRVKCSQKNTAAEGWYAVDRAGNASLVVKTDCAG
jgi:hypothetical protein